VTIVAGAAGSLRELTFLQLHGTACLLIEFCSKPGTSFRFEAQQPLC